jgi:hypothetical protein
VKTCTNWAKKSILSSLDIVFQIFAEFLRFCKNQDKQLVAVLK